MPAKRSYLVLAAGLWLGGCAGSVPVVIDPTKGPHITSVQLPSASVRPGSTINFGVTAQSPEASKLSYRWEVSAGLISDPTTQYPVWIVPNNAFSTDGFVTVTVRVADDKGRQDSRQTQLTVQ